MANPEHLEILRRGVDDWNNWRKAHPNTQPDLVGASLSGANLRYANLFAADLCDAELSVADLHRANLDGAYLDRADFRSADLRGAKFRYTHIRNAQLFDADLSNANLSGAILDGTNLCDADLISANLCGATFSETVLGNTNLSGAIGLDSCRHLAPSTIDHRTIIRSGPLPLAFLRGCGLPDMLIEYLPSLLNQPIQFYSCFISYSTKDQEFADRLHADLQNKGVRCWFAPHDMQGGKKIHEQIDQAIRVYDRLLLILSPSSIDSEWVKTEIAKARKRELQEERRMLFPVRLVDFGTLRDWECFDADAGKDSAREIHEYYVPDFSNWKDHDAYQKEFEKLLRDLKAKP